jgi:anti-sigma factor RsiW
MLGNAESAIVDSVGHLSTDLIERYVLRELSDAETRRLDQHVATCAECEERLQAEIDLAAAMRSSTAAMVRRIADAERKRKAKR